WYSLGEERIGQGRENAKQYLEDHPEIAGKIENELREKLFPVVTEEPTAKKADVKSADSKIAEPVSGEKDELF
ncbi:MAG: DNA recombination/repair protein RecA, partial [Spirochaetaceae bacterium]|nr:DNA recombination/repair protein RecA [Spirochaetaceae bacterium]